MANSRHQQDWEKQGGSERMWAWQDGQDDSVQSPYVSTHRMANATHMKPTICKNSRKARCRMYSGSSYRLAL